MMQMLGQGFLVSLQLFVLTLLGACWRMSTIIQRNTDAVVALTARIDRMDAGNAKEHNEMWDTIERSEDTLNDHEARLQLLEHK